MKAQWLAIFLVVAGMSGGCTHPQKQGWLRGNIAPGPKRMSEPEVLAVAQHFATEQGFSVNDYERPRLSFSRESESWGLWFWEKPPYHPGGYLLIKVDDRTGRAELHPSR